MSEGGWRKEKEERRRKGREEESRPQEDLRGYFGGEEVVLRSAVGKLQ